MSRVHWQRVMLDGVSVEYRSDVAVSREVRAQVVGVDDPVGSKISMVDQFAAAGITVARLSAVAYPFVVGKANRNRWSRETPKTVGASWLS